MAELILTISGSPRKDGVSSELLRQFTQKLDASFAHYDAYESRFAPCTDCRLCRETEGCVSDDMDAFFGDFEKADGIVIASPVYNMSFPSPLKTIIDRMQRYYSARFYLGKRPPIAKRRPVALLLSAGSSDENGDIIVCQLAKIFTVTNCELVCKIIVNHTDRGGCASDATLEIERGAAYFDASAKNITISSR